ncbi:hypothetical protein TNCT_671141 [Trichonephila clavata]|uniref:Uncharacterized protein n=1 Tax=Trichonephila clavata TaxID=2740835 RepID=A0A8X6GCD5_TRICU|nr:hypothetical protein TNCT_671141 [Trichonephila clavata]
MATTLDNSLVMDLSLPPSGNSSRPETLTYSNCDRLKQTANDIRKFTTLTDGMNSLIKSMHFDGFDSDDDPSLQDLKCRLAHYQNFLAMAASHPQFSHSYPNLSTANRELSHSVPTANHRKSSPLLTLYQENPRISRQDNHNNQ